MRIAHLTEAGSSTRANEDRLLVADPVFAVFDGATSLDGYKNAEGITGGALASSIARETFLKTSGSLVEKVAVANTHLRQGMMDASIDLTKKEALWCTSVAAIQVRHTVLDWVQISDSLILIVYANNSYKLLQPGYEHDLETLRLYKKLSQQGVTDLYTQSYDQIIRQRHNMNKTYGVLSGEPQALDKLHHGTELLTNISDILIFSDGALYPKKDPDDPDDWGQYIQLFHTGGIKLLHQKIREIENADPNCWHYPRIKPHDDFTIISITF